MTRENNDNGVTRTCERVLVHQKLSTVLQSGKKILEKANCIVQQQPKSENSCAAQAHSKSSKLHNNHKWLPGEHSEERNMYELHEHVYEHHAHCIGNMCGFSESSEFVMFPWDQPARKSLTPIWYYALMSFLTRCCIHVLAWSCRHAVSFAGARHLHTNVAKMSSTVLESKLVLPETLTASLPWMYGVIEKN